MYGNGKCPHPWKLLGQRASRMNSNSPLSVMPSSIPWPQAFRTWAKPPKQSDPTFHKPRDSTRLAIIFIIGAMMFPILYTVTHQQRNMFLSFMVKHGQISSKEPSEAPSYHLLPGRMGQYLWLSMGGQGGLVNQTKPKGDRLSCVLYNSKTLKKQNNHKWHT